MLFVGDDWAEDHHDIEVVDERGVVLARRRLPEGIEGISTLHARSSLSICPRSGLTSTLDKQRPR